MTKNLIIYMVYSAKLFYELKNKKSYILIMLYMLYVKVLSGSNQIPMCA